MKQGNRGNFSSLCVASALAAALLPAAARAVPQTIYRETFGYCTGTLGKPAADETDWVGLVSGHPKERISNLKVVSYGSADIGGSVNSNPAGLSQGYSFWWKPVFGLSILTSEFQFDAAILKSTTTVIEYRQRLSGVDAVAQPNKTQLAIRIDDTWYISSEFVQQVKPGAWESAQVFPAALSYGTVPVVEGVGPELPATFGVPLPAAGTVKAFGLFIGEVNGRVRFDNFVIKAEVPANSTIDTSVQEPQVAPCPTLSPDWLGGDGQPTPPPDDDDGDTGEDHGTPDTPTPTPTPTATLTPSAEATGTTLPDEQHSTVFEFCPIKQQGQGRAVILTGKVRSTLLRKVPQTTLEDLRDRAIVALLGQRPMPFGALVNSKVGDYDLVTGTISLSTRKAARPIKMRLKANARKVLDAYLGSDGAPRDPLAPLFINMGMHAAHVVTMKALCAADLRVIVKARARQAKVAVAGVYTPRKGRAAR